LRDIFRQVALGGALQVGLTTGAGVLVAMAFGEPFGRGLFYGFVFALSSTAIVLRALAERRELDAPHGRFIVGTLIFQDLCVVPMVLIVPLLGAAGAAGNAAVSIGVAMGKAALVVVGIIALSRFVVPKVLGWVDASRSREVFLLAILGLCIGTAWLTSLAGLSLALGAFLGGMVVADTEYSHRAMGDILPLRDAFVSLFFVSLGMLFDFRVVFAQPLLVAALLAGFLVAKSVLATAAALAMKFPSRVALLAGVGLASSEVRFRARADNSRTVWSTTRRWNAVSYQHRQHVPHPRCSCVQRLIPAGERLHAPLDRATHLGSAATGQTARKTVVLVAAVLGRAAEALVACGSVRGPELN
jgi:CPA2 family monovalent cation:H+ antiporter-2